MGNDLEEGPVAQVGSDSTVPAASSSPKPAQFQESDLLSRSLWTIAESASFLRVSERSVWRMLADPRSRFPRPRRMRGRTLLARDEVVRFTRMGEPR